MFVMAFPRDTPIRKGMGHPKRRIPSAFRVECFRLKGRIGDIVWPGFTFVVVSPIHSTALRPRRAGDVVSGTWLESAGVLSSLFGTA